MKTKLIIMFVFFSFSTLSANPIVVTVAKKILKNQKVIKPIVPFVATITELGAEEIKKPMSKKKLDLYKTKF